MLAVPLILLYTVSSVFGVATIAAGIGQYISYFGTGPVLGIEIAVLAIFCGLNIAGIVFSGIAETILTALKIIPLILISLLLLPFIRPENFVQSVPLTTTGLLATVMIVYWPFTGFEISAIPVEETRDPSLIRSNKEAVMEKHIVSTERAPQALGPYSQAVRWGNLLFISGQVGIDPATGKLVEGGVEAQALQVFKNLEAVLAAAGINFRRLLKTTVFLKDMAHFKAVNDIYAAHVPPPYPARAAVAVVELPAGAAVEIEAVAALAD